MRNQSRREMLRAAPGVPLLLSGCLNRRMVETKVSVIKAPAYSDALYDIIYRLLVEHRVSVLGKRILLKPNLVEFDANAAINTHPILVHAVLEALRKLGAKSILIGEGPGHRRLSLDLAEEAGYFKAIPKFESLFCDLNLDKVTCRTIANPKSKLSEVYLPNSVLSCDLLISLPKMKTHHWAGATLSMKNLFGIVPGGVYGWPKNILHWAGIHECIADLQQFAQSSFAIIDGIEGMEGNGPIQGTTKRAGLLIAGHNLVAVDATCCEIMAIDPKLIHYLSMAGLDKYRAKQIGESPALVQTPFELPPGLAELRLRTRH